MLRVVLFAFLALILGVSTVRADETPPALGSALGCVYVKSMIGTEIGNGKRRSALPRPQALSQKDAESRLYDGAIDSVMLVVSPKLSDAWVLEQMTAKDGSPVLYYSPYHGKANVDRLISAANSGWKVVDYLPEDLHCDPK